ncbi:DUF4132 domain-containing protein [Neolewinella aurantiaca]|uniref:DUF4132 domain-containing protein n=1 Tax=Neolewinella aurantiaca TaxID=2602767 RepID=A0A5C7FB64_9BACT|nr:DUF4132 domain-containing protein [Neolewinella aurantiaca]TXF86668.1 DUF4132 domain-containing protein [Neolewinella aurantiaca]
MSTKLLDSPAAVVKIGRLFLDTRIRNWNILVSWPVKKLILQLERRYKDVASPEPEVVALINEYLVRLKDDRDLVRRLTVVLGDEAEVQDFFFVTGIDHFGKPMNALVASHWSGNEFAPVLHHAYTAKTGRPSAKWLTTARELLKPLGKSKTRSFIAELLQLLCATPETVQENNWYDHYLFLHNDNAQTVKGLLWITSLFDEEAFSRKLSELAAVAYRKVPNKGPLDTKTGNACVTALSLTKGVHGISQLAGLAYRIKQTGIRNKVDKILREVAEKKGVSRQEIEDLSVMEFNLSGDLMEVEIGPYVAEVRLIRPGKSVMAWRREDKTQKSIPKAVKDGFPEELKALKARKKSLERDSINLRDRIDWALRLNREMTVNYFRDTWQKNSLLNFFANRLIWLFSDADGKNSVAVIRANDRWEDIAGEAVDLAGRQQMRLWHPALVSTAEVEEWRNYLLRREVVQPLKQAFREVYLLTAAEERTATYSNRMAAHILKQHQFATLARGRGWAYSLIGAYDHGMESQACYQNLPELGIRVEYIILEMQDGDNYNDVGIWNYVSTDQVRFLDMRQQGEVLDLSLIPPVLLSEILRDTDLFTGVASIGNDDQWADSGGEVFRSYFREYTTRDLSGMGKNRKLALERLIPRLKIRNVATVDDKFVRVTGKLRKYKIHIGSGNILMEPNDQYLCIVPAAFSPFKKSADKLYLPFEGDRTLSIIISKALLLAEDDKITDTTITRQLKW